MGAREGKSLTLAPITLHICLFKSSVCIVFHGLFIGNPAFPLSKTKALPYMKGAINCAKQAITVKRSENSWLAAALMRRD